VMYCVKVVYASKEIVSGQSTSPDSSLPSQAFVYILWFVV